jgi:hypothetical protein
MMTLVRTLSFSSSSLIPPSLLMRVIKGDIPSDPEYEDSDPTGDDDEDDDDGEDDDSLGDGATPGTERPTAEMEIEGDFEYVLFELNWSVLTYFKPSCGEYSWCRWELKWGWYAEQSLGFQYRGEGYRV